MSSDRWWIDTFLVSGYNEIPVAFFDNENGNQVFTVSPTNATGCWDCALLSDDTFAIASKREGMRAFHLPTKAYYPIFSAPPNGWADTRGMSSYVTKTGDPFVAAGSSAGWISVWNPDMNTISAQAAPLLKSWQPPGSTSGVPDVAFVDDGALHLVAACADRAFRVYDVENSYAELSSTPTMCHADNWYRMEISPLLHSAFVPSATGYAYLRQIDLRTNTSVEDRALTAIQGAQSGSLHGMAIIDDEYKLLCAVSGGHVMMLDLRNLSSVLWFNASGHSNSSMYCRPLGLGAEAKYCVTGGNEHMARVWDTETGRALRTMNVNSSGNTLFSVGRECLRWGLTSLYVTSSSVGEVLMSEPCGENARFLMEQMPLLHDAKVIVRGLQGELASFQTFRTLIEAGKLEREEFGEIGSFSADEMMLPKGEVTEYDVTISVAENLTLDEAVFNGVMFGTVEIEELIKDPAALGDLVEILRSLKMNRLLWYVCEQVSEVNGEASLNDSFLLFKTLYERFDDEDIEVVGEVESDEEEDVEKVFSSVITTAAMEGFKKKQKERLGRKVRLWLGGRDLFPSFQAPPNATAIRKHPNLNIDDTEVALAPPTELLAEIFSNLAERTCYPNVEIHTSMVEGMPVFGHVEALILFFDFFKLMLRFEGVERELFERERKLQLEEVTPLALDYLIKFTYLGHFPIEDDMSPPLLDFLLLLRLAEKLSDERLMKACRDCLEKVDTKAPSFLEDLLRVGNVFEDVQCRVEILESWASQGLFSMKNLTEHVARNAEAAEVTNDVQFMKDELEEMRNSYARLEESNEELKKMLEEEREAREKLEDQVKEILRRLDSM